MGRVGIKLELPFSAQVSFCPRLDRFQTPCLPNNLSGEESDQPRQKTRLTVPDCAVDEIRGLTEWSYSISCLTDGGRQLHRETKTEGVKKCLRAFFKRPLPVRLWSQRRLRRPLWPADPQASVDRFVINLARRPEVNTDNDLLSPAQLKTKHDCGGGCLTGVSGVWLRWLLRSVAVARGGGTKGGGVFQVGQWLQSAWWMVKHNEWTSPGRSSLTFKD